MKTNFCEYVLLNFLKDTDIVIDNQYIIRLINSIFKDVIYLDNNGKGLIRNYANGDTYAVLSKAENKISIGNGIDLIVDITNNGVLVTRVLDKNILIQNFMCEDNTIQVHDYIYYDVIDVLDKYNIRYRSEDLKCAGIAPDSNYLVKINDNELSVISDNNYDNKSIIDSDADVLKCLVSKSNEYLDLELYSDILCSSKTKVKVK